MSVSGISKKLSHKVKRRLDPFFLFAFLQLFCFVQRFLRYLNRVCNPALLNRGF